MSLFWGYVLLLVVLLAMPAFAQEKVPASQSDTHASRKELTSTIRIALPKLDCTYCYQLARLIYREAFRRLGYAVELHTFPYERCLLETNSGRMDVEAGRIQFSDALVARYPNLIRVDEPVRTIYLAAYTLDATLHLADWQDLAGQKLIIGYSRGFKLIEQRLAQHQVAARRLRKVTDQRQGARILERRRIEVLLALEVPMSDLLADPEFANSGIRRAGILEQIPVFPYVYQKQRALAPRLATALKYMKADGTYDRLAQQARSKE